MVDGENQIIVTSLDPVASLRPPAVLDVMLIVAAAFHRVFKERK